MQVAYDVAGAVVAHHLRHDPCRHWRPPGRALPRPGNASLSPSPLRHTAAVAAVCERDQASNWLYSATELAIRAPARSRAERVHPVDGERHPAPMRSLEYDVLTPDRTVEHRRLSERPAPSA
ncbi:hypothetical protein [Streptomyces doebereineriae]|uniref:Uncharacterized protein n=1 Tax=Streptomyces doebereineriae TaxID=3075528 RepID=A0ABU2VEN5_9ACTN|nr:hypothetical protein [Streptomyces sp. DSM 41640]MDT0484028.1 hypothetical protein [Streptomyces sp. DSM 41640]